ncbi:ferredoxin [Desulfitispora alkaliphila]|uniref:indolepyruvate ferredoxin oxidoreductase subunit alpha n=1 Tax=Desulfitispora alkaliphila TaxID=622674 RepID=UPI003D1F68F1
MYLIQIDADKCNGCGACVDACPAEYLAMGDDVAEVADGECLGCDSCTALCPEEAITLQEL